MLSLTLLFACQEAAVEAPAAPAAPEVVAATGPAPAVSYQPTTGCINGRSTSGGGCDGVPARADFASKDSWVQCEGTFALCYYSGPQPTDGGPDLSCTVTEGPQRMANCDCLHMTGAYYVDIYGILDADVYAQTVTYCQQNDCSTSGAAAPVCTAINNGELFAGSGAQSISTFSPALASVSGYEIDPTTCDAGKYAGCMTAPCVSTGETATIDGVTYPIDTCTCPTWTGTYQVGSPLGTSDCALGDGSPGTLTWSAADTSASLPSRPGGG